MIIWPSSTPLLEVLLAWPCPSLTGWIRGTGQRSPKSPRARVQPPCLSKASRRPRCGGCGHGFTTTHKETTMVHSRHLPAPDKTDVALSSPGSGPKSDEHWGTLITCCTRVQIQPSKLDPCTPHPGCCMVTSASAFAPHLPWLRPDP